LFAEIQVLLPKPIPEVMSKPAPHAAEPDASLRFRMTFDQAVCSGTLAGVDLEGRRLSASRSMAAYLWESSSSPDGCRDCGRISRSKISSARSAVRLFFGHNPADRWFWKAWDSSYVSSRISFPTAKDPNGDEEWRLIPSVPLHTELSACGLPNSKEAF
jgi:hypothetical protein